MENEETVHNSVPNAKGSGESQCAEHFDVSRLEMLDCVPLGSIDRNISELRIEAQT